MAAGPAANLKGVIRMEPGKRVQVKDLKSSAEYNGMLGRLLQFDPVKMRWGVELDSGKQLSLKFPNLLPLSAEMEVAVEVSPKDGVVGGPKPAVQMIQPKQHVETAVASGDDGKPCTAAEAVDSSAAKGDDSKPSAAAEPAEATTADGDDPKPFTVADAAAAGIPGAAAAAERASKRALERASAPAPALAPAKAAEPPAAPSAPAAAAEEWPVLPTKPETMAKMQSGCWFENESAATRFAEQLRANDASLTSVCLVPPKRFNDDDVREICNALAGNTHCKELLASGHNLSQDSCELLAEMLKSSVLEVFSIGDSKFGECAETLFKGLAQNKTITSLDLEQKGLGVEACQALAAALEERHRLGAAAVTELRLSRNAGVPGAMAALERTTCPAPVELHLSACGLGPQHAEAVGSWVRRGVQSLDLRDNAGLGGEGAEKLFAGLKAASLRKLRLDGCQVGDDGLEALAAALQQGLPLEEVSLERCEITAEGCSALAAAIRRRPAGRLHTLSLRANVFGDEGVVHAAVCAERLDLSSTSLTGVAMQTLAEQPFLSLEVFSNPTLGPAFPAWLASCTESTWGELEQLDFSGCALRDEGFRALCQALLSRPSLFPALTNVSIGANEVELTDAHCDLVEEVCKARGGKLKLRWQDSA